MNGWALKVTRVHKVPLSSYWSFISHPKEAPRTSPKILWIVMNKATITKENTSQGENTTLKHNHSISKADRQLGINQTVVTALATAVVMVMEEAHN